MSTVEPQEMTHTTGHVCEPWCVRFSQTARRRMPHRCPVCDGTGLTNRPPGIAEDQCTWGTSNSSPFPCFTCDGKGMIWEME